MCAQNPLKHTIYTSTLSDICNCTVKYSSSSFSGNPLKSERKKRKCPEEKARALQIITCFRQIFWCIKDDVRSVWSRQMIFVPDLMSWCIALNARLLTFTCHLLHAYVILCKWNAPWSGILTQNINKKWFIRLYLLKATQYWRSISSRTFQELNTTDS